MAWIELDRRTGLYKVGFWLADRKFKRSLKTSDRQEAETARGVAEQTLNAIERGWTQLPAEIDPGDFILSGGRLLQKIHLEKQTSLASLFDAYFNSLPTGSLEPSTINCMQLHRKHLEKCFGKSKTIRNITVSELQRYIEKRSHEKRKRGNVTPVTIKKEVVTLRTVWNWGRHHGLIDNVMLFPSKGIKYPKATEKPPFMTFAEAERRAAYMTLSEAGPLWECVFLSLAEVDKLLKLVKEQARHPFIYPMFVSPPTPARGVQK